MRRVSLLLLACLLTVPMTGAGQDKKEGTQGLSKEEADQGFVSLFDGKSLEGWKGATQGYVPENGLLVCQKKGGGNLFTVKEFGDFVFRFDFRLEPGGNNGVSSTTTPRSTRTSSPVSTTARSTARCRPSAASPKKRASGIPRRSWSRAPSGR
jgi:hypothetical protein